jgi:amino acid adenylation domain-containing protein
MIETPALEKKFTPANVADAYPASPVQQGLLFHSLYEQGSGVYVTQIVCSLSGLRPELFEEAWQRVIERHDVLRTAFVWMSVEKPLQVVGRRVRALIKQMDQRGVSAAEREARFKTFMTEDRRLSFDVAKAPLMRLALWREDDDLYKFVWSHHHLLLDGWAAAIVLKEVFLAYDALSRGAEPAFGPVWPYKNYIAWLQQQDLRAAEAYWRETLAGFRAPTTLNVDRVRRSGTDGYGTRTLRLDHSATANLHALGRSCQLTLNTLVQGAWAVMLSRYSAQKDVCFGAVVAGRPAELTGADEMVGLFINTLPVRTQFMGAATVTNWLRELQAQQLRARNFEYSPLSEVQRWSEIDAGQQLFHNYIVFENYPIDETLRGRIKRLTIHDVESIEQSSYPLVLAVMPGERLTLHIHHDRSRFDDALVDRLLGHVAMLLEAFVANPEQRLNQLPALTTGEQQQLLCEFNHGGGGAEGTAACIHDLFERQVAHTPNAVAVVDDKERVTYAELDARANQLARHLRTLGVGQEVRVGLCVKRSAAMVQGLLGILKAGGVYLPLDSSYPQDRLEFMIDDAGTEVLVTDSGINELLPLTKRSLCVVYLDAVEVASQSAEQLAVPVSPANLAYVIYTSGSTGKPKGVAVTHEAAAGHLRAIQEVFALTSEDRFLQFASQSFDVSVEQTLAPLLTGASIVLRGDEVWSTRDFLKCLHEERLTVVNFPPAFWQQITQDLLAEDELSDRCELRLVIIGGDLLSAQTARRWMSTSLGQARLLNAYGPTEATITATTFDITKQAVAEANEVLPIGCAVGSRVLYVLDQEGHPVPLGVFGELHIGGPLLARGYLNHAVLTAAAFVPDPFSGENGGRLYRTGDVARWLADGTIEFVGRADRQVKIRGFRVELGEIEAALRRHPSVNEAVALAQDDSTTKGKQIVAYVVTKKDSEPTHEHWREFLKEWLPDYMIPGAFISIEKLPLTPNGKVDRIALAALEMLKPSTSDNGSAAAITETERVIADVWAEILGVEQVGPSDNFFELGGHSLVATQIISRLRKKFKVELPFRVIFEEQTVRAIGQKIEESLAEKSQNTPPTSTREITEPPSSFTIKRAPRNGPLPLSFAQERLWFLEQLDPGLPLYNVPAFVKLSGSLNVAAFNGALNELVRRHEILRTSFVSVGDGPSQHISTTLELPLPLTDLSSLPTDQRWFHALDLAAAEVRQPFDLTQAPLLRTQLLRLEKNEHVLLLTMHHIVSDGWSLVQLVREMGVLYEVYCEGRDSQLGELPIQYADYAVWQREQFAGEKVEAPLNYWREQLRGASVLEFPTDHPRPSKQSFSGKSHRFCVPRPLADSLSELSQRQGATLFMTLLTAFQVLLSRYSAQSDVSVGTPVAGRTHTETEALIGLFVNTLVIRAHIDSNESFLQLLDHVRKACLDAQSQQELPFERIVDALQPERALNRHPLFDVMFVMQNPLLPVLHLPGLQLSPLPVETNSAKFDLTLEIEPADDNLRASLEYSSDLFEPDTIHRLAGSYLRLLEAIAADPSRRVASLPLLGEEERQRLVCDLNDTGHDWPWATLPEMFREQARSTPEAAAVEDQNGERLTYAELDHQSEQLARRLRQVKVGPESIVAVLMDRCSAMVVALLAALKSGAAYLPLDPANPPERLRFMLADSKALVILTKRYFLDVLPDHEALVICVDADHESLETEERVPELSPDNLAYVIYTSGSTGAPKGVMVTHRGLANYLRWSSEAYESKVGAGAVVHSPIGFDLTVTSLWIPLISGTRVLLVGEGMGVIEELAKSLEREEKFTLLKLTPAHLEPLAAELAKRSAAAGGLRRLVIGGEALHSEQLSWWSEHDAETQVVNEYGPTETVVGCCVYERAAGELVAGAVPIGRPIANTRLYVLDAGLELVPEGVCGELHVGGAGVSRGYLNRAGLTAERFVPDAFSNIAGARLYKTGDIVRWTREHQLEYAGRADGQIKIRGYRVETAEVEVVLRGHSHVRNAIVVVRDNANSKQLMSYLVAEDGAELSAGELREYLRSRLPEYMIPERFMTLDELPLTVNGKVDRLALSQLEGKDLTAVETSAPPQTVTEEIVAGIWREVLQIESVGVNENFFEKGGHSLLATRVVLRLHEAFDQEFTLQNFFEGPTVAQAAAHLEASKRNGEAQQTPHIGRYDRTEEAPLSFAQERLWFIEHLQPGSALYHIKLRASFKGYLDVVALEMTLNEIVRRHEVLRTSFRDLGNGQVRQHISPMLSLPIPVTDLMRLPINERAETAQRLAHEEEHQPFDLTRAPLLRARLFRFAEDEHLLVLAIHHIAADGWSMGVLVREVSELYAAYSDGHESRLEELPMQYADYATWQREQMAYLFMDEQLIYWREQLRGAKPLELPTDRPRPSVLSRKGAEEPLAVPEELSRELKRLADREGVTLFILMLAAFQILLAQRAGHHDISVGTDIANRNRLETENLIGFFVNQLVLRTDLTGNPSFREVLKRVRAVTLGAYAHQDLPFDRLVDALKVKRSLHVTPLFQVKLIFQNAPIPPIELPNLVVTVLNNPMEVAREDLTLSLREEAGVIKGWFEYDTDLFNPATIVQLGASYISLLQYVVSQPDITLDDVWRALAESHLHDRIARERETKKALSQKVKTIRRNPINLSDEGIVTIEPQNGEGRLPLIMRPAMNGVNLARWAERNRAVIENRLLHHGALLFYGFDLGTATEFRSFVKAVYGDPLEYQERSSPRTRVGDQIYTSTDYPEDQSIFPHNEHSYSQTFPLKLFFFCETPALSGGQTPLADTRKIFARLSPQLRERFIEKKWLLVRNYGNGIGLPWQTVFQTWDRSAVEDYCKRAAISVEWKPDGGLRTRQVRPAVIKHPRTGEVAWFNHATFFHVTTLEPSLRDTLLADFREEDLPTNSYYGDGSPIEASVLEELREAYREQMVTFPWEAGSVVLLDNILTSHARTPFNGPRRILFAMAEPFTRTDL